MIYHINKSDFDRARINNQTVETGTSLTRSDSSAIYFLESMIGSGIVVKDGAGTTLINAGTTIDFCNPVRLNGGFTITGTNLSIKFFEIREIK